MKYNLCKITSPQLYLSKYYYKCTIISGCRIQYLLFFIRKLVVEFIVFYPSSESLGFQTDLLIHILIAESLRVWRQMYFGIKNEAHFEFNKHGAVRFLKIAEDLKRLKRNLTLIYFSLFSLVSDKKQQRDKKIFRKNLDKVRACICVL